MLTAADRTSHPSVLTRNLYGQTWVWAATGRKGATEPNIPDDRFKVGWTMVGDRSINIDSDVSPIE